MSQKNLTIPLVPAASPASRRSILFGIAAAAAAGPAVALPALRAVPVPLAATPPSGLVPSVAGPLPDTALLKLVDAWIAAEAKWRKLSKRSSRSEGRERAFEAAVTAAGELADEVARTRAFTLEGIVAKAKVAVVEAASYPDFAATICLSISRDLLALDGGAKS